MTVTDGNIMISFVFKRQTKSLWEREEKKKENAAFVWFNFFRSWIPTALMMPFSSSKATWGNEKKTRQNIKWTPPIMNELIVGQVLTKKKKKRLQTKTWRAFYLTKNTLTSCGGQHPMKPQEKGKNGAEDRWWVTCKAEKYHNGTWMLEDKAHWPKGEFWRGIHKYWLFTTVFFSFSLPILT